MRLLLTHDFETDCATVTTDVLCELGASLACTGGFTRFPGSGAGELVPGASGSVGFGPVPW